MVDKGNPDAFPDAHSPSAGLGGRRYAAQSGGTQLSQYAVPALQGDGVEVRMEEPTSVGRIDMVVRTDKYVYVMEFKLNKSAEKAMRQITDKHYADSYLGGPQQVFRIGVNFAEETRNIDDWTIEKG